MSRNSWITLIFLLIITAMGYMLFPGCNRDLDSSEIKMMSLDEKATFVGENQCKSCHTSEHNDWKKSDHYMAMLVATDSTVKGDFNNSTFTADGVTNTFFKKGGKFIVNTQGNDGSNNDYEVLFTFGHYPLQQYLVSIPGGKLQSLRVSWDSRDNKWFHQYADQKIHHHDWIHWSGNGQNWNTMCASCHSTDLQKKYNSETDSYNTSWKDINVSCESCHGPGSNHIEFLKTAEYKSGQRLINSGFIYSRDTISELQLNTCAPCHARKTDVASNFLHTHELLDDLIPQVINNEFYFADGQIREEDYEYGSFAQSKMFHNNVRCSNCHNPHSGKLKLEGNLMCMSCHKPEYNNPSHHFHKINTEASQCVSCHMPQKTYMGVDHRRDHSFRIPRPDQSVLYGTPNACNSCHKNESAKWTANAITKWFGPQRTYHFSDDLLPGSKLTSKSEAHLIKLIEDTTQPAIARATAVNYLGNISSQKSSDALIAALRDKNAIVRYHAIRSLQNFDVSVWLQNAQILLSDKVRAVRIAAADLYHAVPFETIPDEIKSAYKAADAENQNYLNNQADFAVGNVMIADYHLKDGDYINAIKNYLRGLEKDSLMNYARLNLSAAYNSVGQNENALQELKNAAKIDPLNERVHYNLGLLYYEMNDIANAMKSFQTSVKLKSENPSLYYNYGLLLQQKGNIKEAENILLKGYKLNPMAENINYALAVFYLQQNQHQKAMVHALSLKQVSPQNPDYQLIFKNLGI